MVVHLTQAHVQRLKHMVLQDMENYGYDGEEQDFRDCAQILEALEHAHEE